MMQHGIDAVEDVPLGDVGVGVVGAELVQRPVGDVLAAVGAVFVVSVEGDKPLGIGVKVEVWDCSRSRDGETLTAVSSSA